MKSAVQATLLLIVLLPLTCLLACSDKEKPKSAKQIEEMRQQSLQRAQSFSRKQ